MAKAPGGKTSTVPFSPHIHSPFTLKKVMWDVVIALLPSTFASVYFFGMNSVWIIGISVVTAVLTELLMNLMLKREITILDGSAVITGILFAFNLPPASPWYLVVIGSFFAVAIVKWAFGGLGYNIMNPALGGRIFVMVAWSSIMINNWSPTIQKFLAQGKDFQTASDIVVGKVPVQGIDSIVTNVSTQLINITNGRRITEASNFITNVMTNMANIDIVSGASPLTTLKASYIVSTNGVDAVTSASMSTAMPYSYWDLFIGNIPGCIGETSALAILIGAIFLILRGVLIPIIPVLYIGSVALLTWIFGGIPMGYGWFAGDPLYHILSGGLMLGAFFMATDYVTSPMSAQGTVIYSLGLGILTTVIRLWGGYPEGVAYSIVIMNLFVPIIDRYMKNPIYGRSKKKVQGAKQ